MQSLSAAEPVSLSLAMDLSAINNIIQPRATLPENLLMRIMKMRDELLNKMMMACLGAQTDLNQIRALLVTNEPEPVDERAKTFVQKMFKVINDGLEEKNKLGINGLRDFLNMTMPCRLHMDEIKPRLTNDAQKNAKVIMEYAGPNNAEKNHYIKALCLKPVKELMGTLDHDTLDNIAG